MSGPPDGKYRIALSGNWGPPPFPIGADDVDGPTRPVVAGGQDQVVSHHSHSAPIPPVRYTPSRDSTCLRTRRTGDGVLSVTL